MDPGLFFANIADFNMQLSWCNQGMTPEYLVFHAMKQLSKSHYKTEIESLQLSNTASGSSFNNSTELEQGLNRLDSIKGLPYGGSAITPNTGTGSALKSGEILKKKVNFNLGTGAAVIDGEPKEPSPFTFHKETWVGAIDLDEKSARKIRDIFKCPICRSQKHTFDQCKLLLQKWTIRKLLLVLLLQLIMFLVLLRSLLVRLLRFWFPRFPLLRSLVYWCRII